LTASSGFVGYGFDTVEKLREQNQYANEKALVFLFVSRLSVPQQHGSRTSEEIDHNSWPK
jgi:hypothetical protein